GHGPPHARTRNDVVAPATVCVVALCHQHHHAARHSSYCHHTGAGCLGADSEPRHLRSYTWRRPCPIPAPVLVLFPPGRVHHDSAFDGGDQRIRPLLLAT